MEMHEYIDILVGQIRSEKAGKMVAEELQAHLEDQALAYEESGMDQEAAAREAVRQMGDPVEVGAALDRIHRPRMDYKMLFTVLILSVAGLLLSHQGLRIAENGEAGIGAAFFNTDCVIVFVGVICMVVVCFLDYTIFYKYILFSYLLLTAFAWLGWYTGLFPEEYGGYTYLGQYIYLFLPLYGVLLYRLRGCGYRMFVWCAGFMISAVIAAAPLFYISYALRFGAAAVFMTSLAIYRGWFRGKRKRLQMLTWGIPITAVLAYLFSILQTDSYKAARLRGILHMQPDASGYYEYYVKPIREVLSNLQWFGTPDCEEIWKAFMDTAAGNAGNVNLLYLFLTKGILAGILVLIVYLLFWGYLLGISLRQKNELGKLVGFGCTILLGIEAFDSVFVNFGVFYPGSGVMPFLMSGKVGTIVYYCLIGILLSIYRYQDVLPAYPKKVKPIAFSKYRISFRVEKVQK